MVDYEKVIKGLNDLRFHFRAMAKISSSRQGRASHIESARTIEDAIALLKVQEPRVLTLQEALGAEVNVDQCWLEVRGIKHIYLADAVVCPEHTEKANIQRWGAPDCQLPLDLYGSYWRMWTAKPTDEQRKAVKWDD